MKHGYSPAPALLTVLVWASSIQPASAAILEVTSSADTAMNDGFCSLREAIQNATTNSQNGRTQPGECPAGSAADLDVIGFFPNTSNITLNSALPPMGGRITIVGGGFGLTHSTIRRNPSFACFPNSIASPQEFRIFHGNDVAGTAEFTFARLVIENGCADGATDVERNGGAMYFDHALVELRDVTLRNNQAARHGGAVALEIGELEVRDSSLTGNQAAGQGGGIWASGSAISRVASTIVSGNQADMGGGIVVAGSLLLDDSEITGNNAAVHGGGIHLIGNGQFDHITLSDNTAGDSGGGIHLIGNGEFEYGTLSDNTAGDSGGGIYSTNGTLTVWDSTISGNSALTGGGIHATFGALIAAVSTISGNTAQTGGGVFGGGLSGNLTLTESTVADNVAGSGSQVTNVGGRLLANRSLIVGTASGQTCDLSGGHGNNNLATDATCLTSGLSNTVVPRAQLAIGPLADHGGSTLTHALGAGSAAIDAGGVSCSPTDQRGVARPSGSFCDVGAYEYEEVGQSADSLVVNAGHDNGNGVCGTQIGECTLRDAVLAAHDIVGEVSISFDPAVFSSPVVSELTQGRIIIARSLSIQGPGRDLFTLDAAFASRHFDIYDLQFDVLSAVSLSGMRLINGRAVDANGGSIRSQESLHLTDMALVDNAASGLGHGGAVFAGGMPDGATVAIDDVEFVNNAGTGGGGLYIVIQNDGHVTLDRTAFENNRASDGTLARGGGLYADVFGSDLSMQDVRFEGNTVSCTGFCGGGGAALEIHNGSDVTVRGTSWLGNSVSAIEGEIDAGGLWLQVDESSVVLESCLIEENSVTAGEGESARGGGAAFRAPGEGSLTVDRCSITDNTSSNIGGGMYLNIPFDGQMSVSDSTISGNASHADGGGILAFTSPQSVLTIAGSTIAQNRSDADSNGLGSGGGIAASSSSSGTMLVKGTIVAGNLDPNGSAPDIAAGTSPLELEDSLIGDNAGTGYAEAPVGSPDVQNNLIGSSAGSGVIDPALASLDEIGTFARIHAILPGSPAIDHFDPCTTPDQIGNLRGIDHDGSPGNDCDVGAVEFTVRIFRHGFE